MARNHGWLDHLALTQSGSIPTYALLPNSLWRSRAKTILFDTRYSVGTLLQKIANIENVITIIPCNAAFSEVLCTPQFYGISKLIAFRSSPYQIFIALDVRLLL